MRPSSRAVTAEHDVFDDLCSTFDISCFGGFPSLLGHSNVDLIPIQSPSVLLCDEDLGELITGSGNVSDDMQLETGLSTPVSQSGTVEGRSCQIPVIPLTVLELDSDDATNASLERTSSDDVGFTTLSIPDNNKHVRGDVRHSQLPPSLSEVGLPKTTNARKISQISSLKSTGNTKTVSGQSVKSQASEANISDSSSQLWQLPYGQNAAINMHSHGNHLDTKPLTEVPKLKLERRRAQNRKAANRCRTKRKMEEEELRKEFDREEEDNRRKHQEIQCLSSLIERMKSELERHTSTDYCLLQLQSQ